MSAASDERIRVRFGRADEALAGDALLIEAEGDASTAGCAHFAVTAHLAWHVPGCACCAPRSGAAAALGKLFLARARGTAPWFSGVVAVTRTEGGADAVRAALTEDRLTVARFRLTR